MNDAFDVNTLHEAGRDLRQKAEEYKWALGGILVFVYIVLPLIGPTRRR